MKSYDRGPTDVALLEETIGANFERTARRIPTSRRWSRSPPAGAGPTRELNAEIDLHRTRV